LIKLSLKTLEKRIGKIKKNVQILGVDTASRTGWCLIKTDSKDVTFDFGVFHIDSKDVTFKFNKIIETFDNIIKPEYKVILEDTFLGMKFMNPYMFKYLSKLGGLLYAVCKYKKVEDVSFLMACSARKTVGIKGNCKKAEVHKFVNRILGVNIEDEDVSDAVVLALNGVKVPNAYTVVLS
jgi:Holliday junction resolvasome RuvABC endonuclease subunit